MKEKFIAVYLISAPIQLNLVCIRYLLNANNNFHSFLSRVSFGFVTGGAQYGNAKGEEGEFPFGGGATSGVTIAPVAFMVADDDVVKVLTISHRNALDKLMENAPQLARELRDIVTESCSSKHSET